MAICMPAHDEYASSCLSVCSIATDLRRSSSVLTTWIDWHRSRRLRRSTSNLNLSLNRTGMVFSSLTFVCLFLPTALAAYFMAPQAARNAVLVAASIVFYVWGGRIAILLILVSVTVNFAL